MNFTWRLYPLYPSAINTPNQTFQGNEPPVAADLLNGIGVGSADNPQLTKVMDNYWLLTFAYPSVGSPDSNIQYPCIFAVEGTPT